MTAQTTTLYLSGDRITPERETGDDVAIRQQKGRYSVSLSNRTLDEAIGALIVVAELAGWDDAIFSFPAYRVEIRKQK